MMMKVSSERCYSDDGNVRITSRPYSLRGKKMRTLSTSTCFDSKPQKDTGIKDFIWISKQGDKSKEMQTERDRSPPCFSFAFVATTGEALVAKGVPLLPSRCLLDRRWAYPVASERRYSWVLELNCAQNFKEKSSIKCAVAIIIQS